MKPNLPSGNFCDRCWKPIAPRSPKIWSSKTKQPRFTCRKLVKVPVFYHPACFHP